MATRQTKNAWAICNDFSGIMISTVASTRREAIDKFFAITGDPNTPAMWRQWKRKGWRASHVTVQEHLFD